MIKSNEIKDTEKDMSEKELNSDRYEHRLDRIETKIDKLADAMISIARAEERIVAIEEDKKNILDALNNVNTRLEMGDQRINKVENDVSVIDKLMEKDRSFFMERIKDHGQRMGELEGKINDASRTTGLINKAFWLIATGSLAYLGSKLLQII